jgi:Lon protease-like protein
LKFHRCGPTLMSGMKLSLPTNLPVMTLPEMVFFPQALLPLHIFEPRYRLMLRDVLANNRIFAVVGLNEDLNEEPDQFEPPYRIATAGIVRVCQKNGNGTSNLLVQGLCRIELMHIVREEPYRRVEVRPLVSKAVPTGADALRMKEKLVRLVALRQKLGAPVPPEIMELLRAVYDVENLVDLTAYNLCESAPVKQRLLETLDTKLRFDLLVQQMRTEIESLKLQKKVQGAVSDEDIARN